MMPDYVYKDGKLVFSDGVKYSLSEALFIARDLKLEEADIMAIHLLKKKFSGTIVGGIVDKDEYAVGPDIEYETMEEQGADFLDEMGKKFIQ